MRWHYNSSSGVKVAFPYVGFFPINYINKSCAIIPISLMFINALILINIIVIKLSFFRRCSFASSVLFIRHSSFASWGLSLRLFLSTVCSWRHLFLLIIINFRLCHCFNFGSKILLDCCSWFLWACFNIIIINLSIM